MHLLIVAIIFMIKWYDNQCQTFIVIVSTLEEGEWQINN